MERSYLRRADLGLMAALFAASLAIRLLILRLYPFDGLYGQDAYAYFDFAAALAGGQPAGAFFWPLGYPILLATAFAVFGVQSAAAQSISLLMGAALAPILYVLARQSGASRFGAGFAGMLMAICGQAVQSSLVIMSDVPALFWATASAAALRHSIHSEKARWLALAAGLLAAACVTRWIYLWLIIPWILTCLLAWRGRLRWRAALMALLAAMTILLPQILYSRSSPFPTFNHAWVQGWSLGHFFQREFENIDGRFSYEKTNTVFYAQPFYDAYYLAPAFMPLIVFGMIDLVRRRQWNTLIFWLAWAVIPYLFLAGIPYQNIRFPLILFPAAAVLAGRGLGAVIDQSENRALWQRRGALALILGVGVIGLGQSFGASQAVIPTFITNQQRDKEAAQWAREHVPDGATLYTFGLTLTLRHYTTLDVYELFYETPITLAEKTIAGKDDYLLLNVWVIDHQWAGREPQIAYHWLRDERGLKVIDRHGNYTLFRIAG